MSRAIYPSTLADRTKDRHGEPYQPSNGTEGEYFFSAWCCHCQRDKSMREGEPLDECDDSEVCGIIANTMAFKPGDAEYPKEWIYGKDGQPCCTAFVQAGDPVSGVVRDDLTADMFAKAAP